MMWQMGAKNERTATLRRKGAEGGKGEGREGREHEKVDGGREGGKGGGRARMVSGIARMVIDRMRK